MRKVILSAFVVASIATGWAQVPLVGVPGASGAVDPQTGRFFPNAGPGLVVNPQTGQVAPYVGAPQRDERTDSGRSQGNTVIDQQSGAAYTDVGDGYVDQRTGRFIPKAEQR